MIHGTPGIGYMLAWEKGGYPHVQFFQGDGFSLRAKERTASLLREGVAPKCYALVLAFEMLEKPEPATAILADDWMPIVNHVLVRQQKGELMQAKPRGRPQKTLSQLREELHVDGQPGEVPGVRTGR